MNSNLNAAIKYPSCPKEELDKWIHFVWRKMREQNNTVPDDVLDYIRDAALKQNYKDNVLGKSMGV